MFVGKSILNILFRKLRHGPKPSFLFHLTIRRAPSPQRKKFRLVADIARRKHLAIISDEVFSPFLFSQKSLPRPAATEAPLVFTLNGFSKMLALPGLKIGWMAVSGDPSLVKKTMHALDMISDTFLPVNETAQFAVPALLRTEARCIPRLLRLMRSNNSGREWNYRAVFCNFRRIALTSMLLSQKEVSSVTLRYGENKSVDEEDKALSQLLEKIIASLSIPDTSTIWKGNTWYSAS